MEFKGTKELQDIVYYNKETGEFFWKLDLGKRAKKGKKAGWLDKTTGYENIKINNIKYKSHRLAWFYVYGYFPKELDHINHIKNDNRICNLKEVEHIDNMKNKELSSNNTSGSCGVSFHKSSKKWTASIKINGKSIHLGSFDNKDDAVNCRKNAEIKNDFHENHGKQLIKEATEL